MGILNKMAKRNQVCGILGLCVSALTVLFACGPGRPETAEVVGRVTFKGQPVPQGRILFWPPKGRPAMAEIGSNGRYELTTFDDADGAMLGEHRVTIKATKTHFPNGNASKPVVEWLVPQRYENIDKTPLTATVTAGKNTIDFDLAD